MVRLAQNLFPPSAIHFPPARFQPADRGWSPVASTARRATRVGEVVRRFSLRALLRHLPGCNPGWDWFAAGRGILVGALLVSLSPATCLAQAKNPAFEARLPGRQAAAKLQWQIGVAAYTFRQFTFFETVDKVAALGIDQLEGFNFQKIGSDIPGVLDPLKMSADDLRKVRAKLRESGVNLVALYYGSFPADEAQCRAVFEKSRELGVKYFVSEPKPALLPMLDRLAREYGMIVGLHGHDKKSSPTTWHPELVAKQCAPFSPAIGAFSDTGHWIRSGLDPADGVEILKERIVGFELHDLHALDTTGRDVPLGTGVGKLSRMLEAVVRCKQGPILMCIECSFDPKDPSDGVRKSGEFLDREAIRLAKAGR